ncbi:MAG: hypothetical protein KDN05_04470 [Verrucomicrobiae bacterium]|nr:hypothetical protein [Verrucomicrobiae bacterium]MCP5532312.1 hypothetical protein [Akkermansiaceae bacterium]
MRLHSATFVTIAALVAPMWASAAILIEVDSIEELARAAARDDQHIRLKPGHYRMADYLTDERFAGIAAAVNPSDKRAVLPFFAFLGNRNRIDCAGAEIEINAELYAKAPKDGYHCTFVVSGTDNTITGLSLRSVSADGRQGGATMVCLTGERNSLEDVTLRLHGSFPFGYGDLLGKGGPNLVRLSKQGGVRVLGSGTTLRRCKVYNRAFGHCFYIQAGDDIRLEDCYAEGVMRATDDMLRETSGPAFDLGFKSVYESRDGRFVISPGYVKALTEDGFRTYGGAGSVTLVNCTAVHTRSGFEIGARDNATKKTVIDNCIALGCERAFLIGSHTVVRKSRGDIAHGPLLYLRGGLDSDVELELVGDGPESLVHAVATIAGRNHRVALTTQAGERAIPALPVMLGFGMPDHAEMSSPIRPAATQGVTLFNHIAAAPVLTSDQAVDCNVKAAARTITDAALRASPGSWNLPPTQANH